MTPKTPLATRFKQHLAALLEKLRNLVTVQPELKPVPVRSRHEKDLERWRNEGGP